MIGTSAGDRALLKQLLAPSWASGAAAVSVGLLVAVGTIIAFSLNNSAVQQQLLEWQATQTHQPATSPAQRLSESDRPTFQGSWPLIIVWSFIGLGVYVIAASIIHSINQAADLRKSLDYVNAKPHSILETAAEHFAVRMVGFIMLVILVYVFLHQIIPYAITAAHASASDPASLDGVLYLLLSFSVVVLSLHAVTIFLRLSLGRVRAFYL